MKKSTTSVVSSHFSGKQGKWRLVEALKSQTLISGNSVLARTIAKSCELSEKGSGDVLVQQGESNNDILLIVSGDVSIWVNGRQIATRSAGTHVGEMSLVDPLAKRSATVIAIEPSFIVRVPEHIFARLAKKYPELWRRIAVELASRLRERNRFLPKPHDKPVIFIGSSTEGLKYATAAYDCLSRSPVVPRLWSEGVFETSQTSIESLVSQTQDADFAVLLLTSDDLTVSRGKKKPSPRDNVIFELGLFMGALTRQRVFIVKPKRVEIRIPSDLLGVTWLDYSKGGAISLRNRMKPICQKILKVTRRLGSK